MESFDFALPRERIAQHPATPRDAARLLFVGPTLDDRHVRDLPDLLRPGDLLVFNDTKVIPARLYGRRGEAQVEVTLFAPVEETMGDGLSAWRAFARPARRLKPGDRIAFAPDFAATVAGKGDGGAVTLSFEQTGGDLRQALERHGAMPLPPYIHRPRGGDPRDRADYQTVFAAKEGAIAAPTAGLHFTPALLDRLEARGIKRVGVTLHVGIGTFLPVTAEDPRDHRMHAERGTIDPESAATINAARAAGGRIIAIGTTALRLLESATDATGRVHPFADETDLFILPGYRFRAIDLLLTNFHLPRSTLFMLVCAFAGTQRMQEAYAHAIQAGYRFFSYGDCSLLTLEGSP